MKTRGPPYQRGVYAGLDRGIGRYEAFSFFIGIFFISLQLHKGIESGELWFQEMTILSSSLPQSSMALSARRLHGFLSIPRVPETESKDRVVGIRSQDVSNCDPIVSFQCGGLLHGLRCFYETGRIINTMTDLPKSATLTIVFRVFRQCPSLTRLERIWFNMATKNLILPGVWQTSQQGLYS